MAFDYKPLVLPFRVAQFVLAVIILALLAYAADTWWWESPSQVNFVIFCAVWTLLAVAYLFITPTRYPSLAHKYAIVTVEAITMVFWFAGFIALAVLLTDVGCRRGGTCGASIAADIFAAFEWLMFLAGTFVAARHCYTTRNSHSTKADPAIEAPAAVPYEGA